MGRDGRTGNGSQASPPSCDSIATAWPISGPATAPIAVERSCTETVCQCTIFDGTFSHAPFALLIRFDIPIFISSFFLQCFALFFVFYIHIFEGSSTERIFSNSSGSVLHVLFEFRCSGSVERPKENEQDFIEIEIRVLLIRGYFATGT